nr:uncharacterized protein LOC113736724 [Coffea arabica]
MTPIPEVPVSGSSLFNLHHVPPQEVEEDKRHSGAQWCSEWDLNVNDRYKDPKVAQELMVHSVLPRDHVYARKLTPPELMQSASVAWVSTTAFLSEMTQRYTNLFEHYQPSSQLQQRVAKLEEKLKATEQERDKAVVVQEQTEATNNSLRTALDEEKGKRVQEEQSAKEAIEKAGTSALEAFRKSEAFTRDLDELTLPRFMFRYTSAVNDAAAFLSAEQLESLKDKPNFNKDAKELCDRMTEGIQTGRDLAEVRKEFNQWLSEFNPKSDKLGGNDAGGGEVGGDPMRETEDVGGTEAGNA